MTRISRRTPVTAIGVGIVWFFAAGAMADGLAARIGRVLEPLSRLSGIYGVSVVDLDGESVVFRRGADQALIPASNQKLLVISTAVDMLGREFEFQTLLGRRGFDLVVIGDGDPAIGDERLASQRGETVTGAFERWAAVVHDRGWTRIGGDLVIDESLFDGQWTHPSWEHTDLGKWYGAPVGALNLNDNCIEFTVEPAPGAGPPRWWVHPPCALVQVDNRATSSTKGTPVVSRLGESFRYVLNGKCGSRATLQSVPVPDPGLFFAHALRDVLQSAGIEFTGSIRRERIRNADASLPADVDVIARYRTPLRSVLGRVGKNSQNMFAESLAKRVGYEYMRRTSSATPTGGWVTAASAVTAFLRRAGIDTSGLIVSDASGLSRDNRVTADQLVALLAYMHRHRAAELFASSLAVAGRDGSLRKRMRDIEGNIQAKTGTLRGVKALSGYALKGGVRRFAFSIIINGIRGSSAPYKRVQDELCRALVNHDR